MNTRMSVIPLGELCQYENGGTPSKKESSYWGGEIPWITSTEVNGGTVLPARSYVTAEGIRNSAAKQVPEGTLLLVTRTGVGKVAITPYAVAFSQDITAVFPQSSRLDVRYLRHFLDTQGRYFDRLSRGATIKGITRDVLNQLGIPLPPLPEQKRLADVLDKADGIRRKRQHSVDLLNEFLKSSYLALFADPRGNRKSWRTEPLGVVCSVDRGKFTPRPRNDPKYYGGAYPFIQTGDISSSGGLLSKWKQTLNDDGVSVSRSFRPGTIVIAIVGATIGETAILMDEMYCPDSVIGIVPKQDKATSEFIEFTLRFFKQRFRDMAPETARANINLDTLRPLQIPVPPMPLQRQFSHLFQKCYALKHKVMDPRDETEDLFNSLVQRAFRGEL